VNLSLTGVSL